MPGIPLALAFVLAGGLGAEGGSIRWPGAASLHFQRWKDCVLCRRPPLCSGELSACSHFLEEPFPKREQPIGNCSC